MLKPAFLDAAFIDIHQRTGSTNEWTSRTLEGARPRCAPTNWVAGLLFGTEAQVLAPMIGPGG